MTLREGGSVSSLFTEARAAIVLAAVAAGCGGGSRQEAPASSASATTTATAAVSDSAAAGAYRDPASPAMRATAPAEFRVTFETSAGTFVVAVHREWAPLGADRFYSLARSGFFDGARFFRVLPGFVAQFGMHGDPGVSRAWFDQRIPDDPVRHTNARGTLTFATSGPNSRTTQLFVNYRDNNRLDGMGFAPFGEVVEGMDVVEKLHSGYGEGAPQGSGPNQGRIMAEGNVYLERDFPRLDFVKRAFVNP
jgi:peptidyl-prolyl cis-trans isomerase A (cyclophilin A)